MWKLRRIHGLPRWYHFNYSYCFSRLLRNLINGSISPLMTRKEPVHMNKWMYKNKWINKSWWARINCHADSAVTIKGDHRKDKTVDDSSTQYAGGLRCIRYPFDTHLKPKFVKYRSSNKSVSGDQSLWNLAQSTAALPCSVQLFFND